MIDSNWSGDQQLQRGSRAGNVHVNNNHLSSSMSSSYGTDQSAYCPCPEDQDRLARSDARASASVQRDGQGLHERGFFVRARRGELMQESDRVVHARLESPVLVREHFGRGRESHFDDETCRQRFIQRGLGSLEGEGMNRRTLGAEVVSPAHAQATCSTVLTRFNGDSVTDFESGVGDSLPHGRDDARTLVAQDHGSSQDVLSIPAVNEVMHWMM